MTIGPLVCIVSLFFMMLQIFERDFLQSMNQRTNGPVNAHLISWPSNAQNIQNLENTW